MKKHLIIIYVVLALVACQRTQTFTINGNISNADGETLYLEHTALLQTSTIDSCTLNARGNFSLKAAAPTYPDFYRLRLGTAILPLAIDSTETITITTTRDSLTYTSNIEGSENSLTIAHLRTIARTSSRNELREATKKVIAANPLSLSAYYAVFMKQNGAYIWNIFDPSDRRMFQAVATSFNTWMPNYERTKALYTQVKDIMQAERNMQHQAAVRQLIENTENAFLDITLTDDNGINQSLSNLRGKVIVLDFSAIEMEQSSGYIFELRELYNQYHKRGLAIYSVSLDRNKLLWEDGVTNLPWTNVYAGDTATDVLTRYNVQSLPTLFLLDRKGTVQGRYTDFKKLDTDIQKYL